MELQTTNEVLTATLNAQSLNKTAEHLAFGDTEAAMKQLNNNPILKQQLREKFGIVSVQPVNWATDYEKLQKVGINIKPEDFKDPQVVEALNSTFYKVVKEDGTTEIQSVPLMMKTINFQQYAEPDTLRGVEARFNKVQEILKGHIKTPEEEAIESNTQQATKIKSEENLSIEKLRSEVLNNILNDTKLSPEEKLNKITGATNAQSQEDLLNLQKTLLDIEKKSLDVKKAKNELKASEPVKDTVKFLQSLDKASLTDETYEKAKKIQGKAKLSPTDEREVLDRARLAKAFSSVAEKFKNIDRNAFIKFSDEIAKVLDPRASVTDKQAFLERIGVNTELGLALSDYVKMMSGTAVSNQEYTKYLDLSQAGVWSNKESAEKALKSMSEYMTETAKKRHNALKNKYPLDYLLMRDAIDSATQAPKKPKKANIEVPNAKYDLDKYML